MVLNSGRATSAKTGAGTKQATTRIGIPESAPPIAVPPMPVE
jgi:hypothetical protein